MRPSKAAVTSLSRIVGRLEAWQRQNRGIDTSGTINEIKTRLLHMLRRLEYEREQALTKKETSIQ